MLRTLDPKKVIQAVNIGPELENALRCTCACGGSSSEELEVWRRNSWQIKQLLPIYSELWCKCGANG